MINTFILRTEWYDSIMELDPCDKAVILDNLFHYHMGNDNLINLNNLPLKLVWKFLIPNLKRNIESYDKRRETSSENGLKGGRPKKQQENNLNNLNKPIENLSEPIETLSTLILTPIPIPIPIPILKKEKEFSKNENSHDSIIEEVTDSVEIINPSPLKKQKEKNAPQTGAAAAEVSTSLVKTYDSNNWIEGNGDGEFHHLLAHWYLAEDNKSKYPVEMLQKFKAYWTAKVQSGTKKEIGKELWRTQKTFQIGSRLATWFGNGHKYEQKNGNSTKPTTGGIKSSEWNASEVALGAIAILKANRKEREEFLANREERERLNDNLARGESVEQGFDPYQSIPI